MAQYIADESKLIRSSLQTPAGRAASFDGVNDFINIGNSASLQFGTSLPMTWSAWFYLPSGHSNDHSIVMKQSTAYPSERGYALRVIPTNQMLFSVGDGTVYAQRTATIEVDKWTHVVGTFDGVSTTKLYVNGCLVSSGGFTGAVTGGLAFSTYDAAIGALTTPLLYHLWLGKLRDIRCYSAALTAAEIAALYNATKTSGGNVAGTIYADRLVGWWLLEEYSVGGFEIPWYDMSGNELHGHGNGSGITSYSGADVPCSILGELGQSLRSDFATGTQVVDANLSDFTSGSWSKNGFTASNATTLTCTLAAAASAYAFWNQLPSVVGGGYDVGDAHALEFEARVASGSTTIRTYMDGSGGIRPQQRFPVLPSQTYLIGTEWKQVRISADVARVVAGSTNQVRPIIWCHDSDNGGAGGTYTLEFRNVKLFTNVVAMPMPAKATDLSKDVRGAALQYPGPLAKRATMSGSPCATFDGINDSIQVLGANNLDFERNEPFSCSMWVYRDTNAYAVFAGTMLGSGTYRGWSINPRFGATRKLQLDLISTVNTDHLSVYTVADVLTESAWQHVAFTYNGSSTPAGIRLYVNGVSQPTATGFNSLASTTITAGNFRVGSVALGGNYFDGNVCDLRVFDSQLSDDDIATIYAGDETATVPVAHYPLSENSGLRLHDVTANGRHATASGATSGELWANTQAVYHYGAAYGIRNQIGARRYRALNGSTQYFDEPTASKLNDPAAAGVFWVCWYGRFTAASAALQGLVARWEGAAKSSWILYRLNATTIVMEVSHDLTNSVNAQASIVDDGLDHLCFGYLNMSTRQIGIAIDGAAFAESAFGSPKVPQNPSVKLKVCAYSSPATAHFNGIMKRAAIGQVTGSTTPTAIRDAIRNSGSPLLYSQLTDQQRSDWGLLAWYDCDEWGPQLLDKHGSNHLSGVALTADYPTPQVPALLSEPTRHYGDFAGAYCLVGPDDTRFEATAGSKFWVAALVRAHNASAVHAIVSKYTSNTEWTLYGNSTVWAMTAVNSVGATVAPTVALTANEWALLVGYIDATADPAGIGLSKNGAAFATTTLAGTPRTGTDTFAIGRYFASNYPDADIAFVATGKLATATFAQLRDALYNSGTPLTYDQVDASQKVAWGLAEWFEVGEYEGTEQLLGKHAATVLNGSCIPSSTTHGGPKKLAPVATAIDFTGGTAAPWTDKQFLGYWTCTGAASGIDVAAALVGKFTDSISVFARIRGIDFSANPTILAMDNGAGASRAEFYFSATNYMTVWSDTSYALGSTIASIATDLRWHDLLWVWSGTQLKGYLDNVLKATVAAPDFTTLAAAHTRAKILAYVTGATNGFEGDIARIVVAAGVRVPGNILSAPNVLDVRFDGARCEDHQGRMISYAAVTGHTPAKLTVPTAYKHGVILPAGMTKQTNGRSENSFALYSVDQ